MRKVPLVPLILSVVLLGTAATQAQSLKHCFNDSQFSGWWRPAGDKTLYIRTNNSRYYRLDLAQSCPASRFPGAHLILNIHGTNTICSPLDFDLRLSQGVGAIPQPCLVRNLTEVAAGEATVLTDRER